ncbi:hypothetical protein Ssi03_07090 [Sphaerisporangium siamense]|uniref:Glycosyltransferase RgtA/B/C/D-like domain-containing protein n=1 Tax=Sphaerisporangium siamense TaxID=795645 RepID=A0A7W7DFM5_9ACTN|nr:hypothetical protein [Sphaerisporangium siamense]MBB4705887.1 hypothetical protein [Sphaerisporangium siamense]GII82719.1 hypothetical protein Ssi03_07090 [Sphaerisporangium siamense]
MDGSWRDHPRRPPAGRVLAAVTIMPSLALAGWLLAGLPLLLLGRFRPLPAFVLGTAVAVVLCVYAARRSRRAPEAAPWQVAGVVAVALGSGVFNALLHSQQLLIRRDPSTYAQYAVWLARTGSLPIPYQAEAFGGPDPALRFDSVGLYDHGGAVVPQFMPGAPLLYAPGHWLAGVDGLLVTPAVLGALAVLTVAGVVARLAGARWATLGALLFAVALPILYTSRTTLSEIPSLILLFGGIALTLDARGRPRAAALAGLVFGLAVLVRIDGLRDVLPVLAYAGLLIAMRRVPGRAAAYAAMGPWLLGGLVVGAGAGLGAAFLLARPYLAYLSGSVTPLLVICGAVLALTAVGAALGPRVIAWSVSRSGGLARRVRTALPGLAGGLVVLVMAGFAARPWLQTVRRVATTPDDKFNAAFIESVQRFNGLPPDNTRLYYEDSLYWVIWYLGVPAVALATIGAAVLAGRMARGRAFAWVLPLALVGWTTVTTLWLPAITPDHPFASRRLVPVVIPGLVVLAVWAVAAGWAWARRAGYGVRARRAGALAAGALLVVPAAVTSVGTAFTPIEQGEAAQVARLCAALPRDAAVLIVERVTADRLPQVVRGMCGAPTAMVRGGGDVAPRAEVERLIARIRAAGRHPVLLAADRRQLAPYGTATEVLRLRTRQDERSLISPPDGTWSLSVTVWMATP